MSSVGTLRNMHTLTPGEREAIELAHAAFEDHRPCWTSPSLRLFNIVAPIASLTPQQRAAVKALRRVGWDTIIDQEYVLCDGEWYVT